LARLCEHDWPGNVRELEAEIERAVLLCPDGGIVASEHLTMAAAGSGTPPGHAPAAAAPDEDRAGAPVPAAAPSLEERIPALDRATVTAALLASGGNKAAAARALGLTRNGLAYKLKRLGLLGLLPPRR